MSIQAGIAVAIEFSTRAFSSGIKTNADSLPVGTVVANGTDDAAPVVITNKATGLYKAVFTVPAALVTGDQVQLRIAATVGGISDNDVVWEDSIDEPVAGVSAAVWAYSTRTLTSFGPVPVIDSVTPFADPHVGDVGTELVVVVVDQDLTVVDVSAATDITIFLKRPGSSTVAMAKTGVLDSTGADGKIRYNTVAGDFTVPGNYKVQGRVTIGSETFHSAESEFYVKGNLG